MTDAPRPSSLPRRIAIAAGLAIAALVALSLVTAYHGAQEVAHQNACRSNLKQLGLAVLLYRDNQGTAAQLTPLPHSGSDLWLWVIGAGLANRELLICPSSGDPVPAPGDVRLGNSAATSYAGPARPLAAPPASGEERAIGGDDTEGPPHHPDGRQILFADGHAEHVWNRDARQAVLGRQLRD